MSASSKKGRGDKRQEKGPAPLKEKQASICANAACKLRKAGCSGFEACPGYKGR